MLTHPSQVNFFRETIFRPLGGAVPSNFYTPYNPLNCISSWTWGTRWPQVGLCTIYILHCICSSNEQVSTSSQCHSCRMFWSI